MNSEDAYDKTLHPGIRSALKPFLDRKTVEMILKDVGMEKKAPEFLKPSSVDSDALMDLLFEHGILDNCYGAKRLRGFMILGEDWHSYREDFRDRVCRFSQRRVVNYNPRDWSAVEIPSDSSHFE